MTESEKPTNGGEKAESIWNLSTAALTAGGLDFLTSFAGVLSPEAAKFRWSRPEPARLALSPVGGWSGVARATALLLVETGRLSLETADADRQSSRVKAAPSGFLVQIAERANFRLSVAESAEQQSGSIPGSFGTGAGVDSLTIASDANVSKLITLYLLACVRSTFNDSSPGILGTMAAAVVSERSKERLDGIMDEARALFFGFVLTTSDHLRDAYMRRDASGDDLLNAGVRELSDVNEAMARKAGTGTTASMDKRCVIIQTAFKTINVHRVLSILEGFRDGVVYFRPARKEAPTEIASRELRRWRKMDMAELVFLIDGDGIETRAILAALVRGGLIKHIDDVDSGRLRVPPNGGCARISEWAVGPRGVLISLRGDAIDARPPRALAVIRRFQ